MRQRSVSRFFVNRQNMTSDGSSTARGPAFGDVRGRGVIIKDASTAGLDFPELSGLVCKAFVTALLLTGIVEEAEAAVLEAIRLIDSNDGIEEALLSLTVI